MTCDELRKLIREEITSISQSELQKIIKDEEFRKMIRNETKDSIRAEIDDPEHHAEHPDHNRWVGDRHGIHQPPYGRP